MTGLLLPRGSSAHRARAARIAAQAQEMPVSPSAAEGVVASIKNSARYSLSSDEFLSKDEIWRQVQLLCEHIEAQGPDYNLPRPLGWLVQVLVLTFPEESAGGLLISDDIREANAHRSVQGVVLNLGSAAYTDPERFSQGGELVPWCGQGDRVQLSRYDIQSFELANGQKLGIISDTRPLALIDSGWTLDAARRRALDEEAPA